MELIILQNCIKLQCWGHSLPTNRVWSHSVIYKEDLGFPGDPTSGLIQFEHLFWTRQKFLQNDLRTTKTSVTPKKYLQNEALQNAL